MTDWKLLSQYIQTSSQEAFAALVHRHSVWVYSTAARIVRDRHTAEDVAQAVFIILANKAHTISERTSVAGWLFNATRYSSAHALRAQRRRTRHEKKAALMKREVIEQTHDPAWDEVAPFLDQFLARLSPEDRDPILLRFFERASMSGISRELGISEDAAKRRVSRAVGHLRSIFLRSGVTLSDTAFGAMLLANATPAPPLAGLPNPTQIMATMAALRIAKGALLQTLMPKLKVAAVALVAVSGLALGLLWFSPQQRASLASLGLTEAAPNRDAPVAKSPQSLSLDGVRPGDGIGLLRLRMTRAEAINTLGPPEKSSGGSLQWPSRGIGAIFTSEANPRVATILGGELDPWKSSAALTQRTPEGLGIGSTESEILAIYGAPSRALDSMDAGLPASRFLSYWQRGIEFKLSKGHVVFLSITARGMSRTSYFPQRLRLLWAGAVVLIVALAAVALALVLRCTLGAVAA